MIRDFYAHVRLLALVKKISHGLFNPKDAITGKELHVITPLVRVMFYLIYFPSFATSCFALFSFLTTIIIVSSPAMEPTISSHVKESRA